MASYDHAAVFDSNLNTYRAFGNKYKIERNVHILGSIFRQTTGIMLIGDRTQEFMRDPLHRDPRLMKTLARQQASIAGRSRGYMRPAAPRQVDWKSRYVAMQKSRTVRSGKTAIGPYTMGSLEQKSILYRINSFMRGTGQ